MKTIYEYRKGVTRELEGSTHTLPILFEYAWSMLRVCLQYAYSMPRVCLAYAKSMAGVFLGYVFVRRERTLSPTCSDSQSVGHGLPGTLSLVDGSKMTRRWFEDGSKESRYIHGGNTEGPRSAMRVLRYAACLILLMVVGIGEMWGATITYHIINLGRLDNNGALTSTRTEALQFTTTETTVGVPDKYKSPLAKNWQYYSSGDVTFDNDTKVCVFNSGPSLSVGNALSDGAHVYVTYELDKDKFREVGIYNRGIYKIKFPDNYYLKQTTWYNSTTKQTEVNTGSAEDPATYEFLWKFNIIDPYQITVQSQSGSYLNWYLCSKLNSNGVGNFGDIRLNATISGALATDVWVFGLLNGGTSDTYRLVVTDGYTMTPDNSNQLDSFGHGYLNNKRSGHKTTYQLYNKDKYDECNLTFEPVTKNYIIVNNSGEPLVQALSDDNTLDVPGEIKSPLASYTYYGTQQDAISEGTQLSSATGATIYVRYTTRDDVLNLKGEIKYNISVGGTNYLYAADATTISSETTSDNNANNNHKWILTGNDAYQITIKNVGNSKEMAYDVSSGEAVPTLSATGSKFFFHQSTDGKYEVVAITSNDYSTPNYYTLGLDAGNLKLYSNNSHAFGETEIKTVFTPRPMAAITTPPAANSLTYNGSNQELVTSGSASNGTMKYRIGDTGSYETSIPAAKDANTYSVYYMAAGSDGYEDFVASEPIEVTINKQSITVSGIIASNKTYDGTPTATLVYTGATLTGNFDGENLTISATGTFDNKNVGIGKTVTISDLTLGGTAVGNYELAASGQQTSTTADITVKDITASGTIAASNKVYNGTTTAVFDYSGVTLTGKVDGDDLSYTATGAFADKNVGTGKTVTISGWTLSGNDVGNYNLVSSSISTTTTADITAAEITVNGITAENKVYNGNTTATLVCTNATFMGKVEGDVLSVTATGAFADAYVGTEKTVTISGWTLGGADSGNYTLAGSGQQTETTADITAKAVTITANDASKDYDGTPLTEAGFTTSALEEGDTHTFSIVMTAESTITNIGTTPNVIATVDGVAVTTGVETAVGNYLVTTVDGTLTIVGSNNIHITLTMNGWTYGDNTKNPSITITPSEANNATKTFYYKVKDADDATYTTTQPTKTSNAGTYTVKVVVEPYESYNGGEATTDFTISKATLTITAQAKSKDYLDPDPEFTYTVSGLKNSERQEDVLKDCNLQRVSGENVGTYNISINETTFEISPNYTRSFTEAKLTINKKHLGDGETPAPGIGINMNDGNPKTVSVFNGQRALESTDYTYTITDNVVTITAAGNNCTGSAKATYSSVANDFFHSIDANNPQSDKIAVYTSTSDQMASADLVPCIVGQVNPTMGTLSVIPVSYIPKDVPVILLAKYDVTGMTTSPKNPNTPAISESLLNNNQLLVAPDVLSDPDNPASAHGVHVEDTEAYVFYKGEFVLTTAGTITAGKYYLKNPNYQTAASPSTSANPAPARSLAIVKGETTGIIQLTNDEAVEGFNDVWYTIDGQKLDKKPTRKGLYIHNGKKHIVK